MSKLTATGGGLRRARPGGQVRSKSMADWTTEVHQKQKGKEAQEPLERRILRSDVLGADGVAVGSEDLR
ncbi:uncharacterized protein N7498_001558 [Penicillium cinerascens]|uniref:Uncharacterized protein n=1 Tax=Penicillium cinerascens TaxID=70096 RepID=A0A9W9NIW1_9EURO|nr:uncharacterized protein N7498_001558 [Penicillium cinerascens]KAJ5219459.1 hypothetical protein N7498_001558 [Penicillium cinerascens]